MENALTVPAFAAAPVRPSVNQAIVSPVTSRPKTTPCAFRPIHHIPPIRTLTPPPSLMRQPPRSPNIGIEDLQIPDLRNTSPDGATPQTLPLAQSNTADLIAQPQQNAVSPLQRVENFLNELLENPEYRDLAKTVIANGAALIELSRFVYKALDDFKLASTMTGGGIMTIVVGLALIISGGQIAQKIPGSAAAMKAKTDFCVKQITDEIAAQAQLQSASGLTVADLPTRGTPEFDLAVEQCVQQLRTIPSNNKLNLTVFRDFVRDVLMHIQNVIALFNRPQASPVAA